MSKKIEALKAIVENLNIIIEEIEGCDTCSCTESSERGTPASKPKTKKTESAAVVTEEVTEESLGEMGYNDLKSLAKQLGVNAKGSREELVNRILSAGSESESADEDPTEEAPVETPKPVSKRKIGKAAPVQSEPVEEDPLYAQVEEAVAELSDEELLDMLHEVGVRAKGKRQSLISYAVKAVRDGLISLDDEADESDEDSADDADENDDEEMTEERADAVQKSNDEIDDQFNSGEIGRDDLVGWYAEAFGENLAKVKKMTDDALLEAYKESAALFIDDEGQTHEEGEAYVVNGEVYCCGTPCQFNEDDSTFVCECCGNEYEGGDE